MVPSTEAQGVRISEEKQVHKKRRERERERERGESEDVQDASMTHPMDK